MQLRFTSLLFILITFSQTLFGANVGLLVMATGKYDQFVKPLVESARKYFLPGHNVTFYVFTDENVEPADDIVVIYQKRLGWPFDTLFRYQVYLAQKDILLNEDYLFASDVDMLFVDIVGDEILGERVATQHPGFYGRRGSFCPDPRSTAYVREDEGADYFCGGFQGGSAEEVMRICEVNSRNIQIDLQKNLIVEWHDEMHWNRYCIDHKPTVILSPSYCYPESWSLPFTKRLLALDKNHKEFQTPLENN